MAVKDFTRFLKKGRSATQQSTHIGKIKVKGRVVQASERRTERDIKVIPPNVNSK